MTVVLVLFYALCIVIFVTAMISPDRMNRQRQRIGLPEISTTALRVGAVAVGIFAVALLVLGLTS